MGMGRFPLLWMELELNDRTSHYMLCGWICQHSHYNLFDPYSNFLTHCLKKLPSNLVQTEQLQCLAPNIVIQWAAVVCTWCIQTAVACKSISHSRKLFLCFSSCQKSWMWQQAGMGMLLTAPSSCPLSSPHLYTTEKTSLLSQEHL